MEQLRNQEIIISQKSVGRSFDSIKKSYLKAYGSGILQDYITESSILNNF